MTSVLEQMVFFFRIRAPDPQHPPGGQFLLSEVPLYQAVSHERGTPAPGVGPVRGRAVSHVVSYERGPSKGLFLMREVPLYQDVRRVSSSL